jgi:hypothetical protein
MYFHYRDHLLQGFETSTLVFFAIDIKGMHNNRVFSRCIANLILVVREDVAKSLQLDENLSVIIPIYGLLLFEKSYSNLLIIYETDLSVTKLVLKAFKIVLFLGGQY